MSKLTVRVSVVALVLLVSVLGLAFLLSSSSRKSKASEEARFECKTYYYSTISSCNSNGPMLSSLSICSNVKKNSLCGRNGRDISKTICVRNKKKCGLQVGLTPTPAVTGPVLVTGGPVSPTPAVTGPVGASITPQP